MQAYYSREALAMDQWAREEPNRVKASHIYRVAQNLEQRYRDYHKDEVNDHYKRPVSMPMLITRSRVQPYEEHELIVLMPYDQPIEVL